MKARNLLTAFGAAVLFLGIFTAEINAQDMIGGPGIVMSGSENYTKIPAKARSFINKHFKNLGVRSCEKDFLNGSYEVDLVNGIEIKFNKAGNVIEIDAADNSTLPIVVVKDVIHHRAFKHLENNGYANKVKSIEFEKNKACSVELQIPDPDTYQYNKDGIFIGVND